MPNEEAAAAEKIELAGNMKHDAKCQVILNKSSDAGVDIKYLFLRSIVASSA